MPEPAPTLTLSASPARAQLNAGGGGEKPRPSAKAPKTGLWPVRSARPHSPLEIAWRLGAYGTVLQSSRAGKFQARSGRRGSGLHAARIAVVMAAAIPPGAVWVFEIVLNATSMFDHADVSLPPSLDGVIRPFVVTPAGAPFDCGCRPQFWIRSALVGPFIRHLSAGTARRPYRCDARSADLSRPARAASRPSLDAAVPESARRRRRGTGRPGLSAFAHFAPPAYPTETEPRGLFSRVGGTST